MIIPSPYVMPGLPKFEKIFTPDEIIDLVCFTFHVKKHDLFSTNRQRKIVTARQTIGFILVKFLDHTLKATGRLIGGEMRDFDHSTILYGNQKVKDLCETNSEYYTTLKVILKKINSNYPYLLNEIVTPNIEVKHQTQSNKIEPHKEVIVTPRFERIS